MTSPEFLIQFAKFVRDTLKIEENAIRIGRENYSKQKMEETTIVVDYDSAEVISQSSDYKGERDTQRLSKLVRYDVVVQFYGKLATQWYQTFINLVNSERALDEQKKNNIGVSAPYASNRFQFLAGAEYESRTDVNLYVFYNEFYNDDVNWIETSQLAFINDK